ncbi:Cytosine deaminase [Crocosphaera watsonii WH 8502]|uniref:Cytosine deaminase n=1 Tax=Crocosphaera watsonii WH 8502 TaxID=423474 RepID=T2IN54_CROWT|nr:Cytosine deaminase [Crocosphaera watsonii WH 8502]
MLGVRSSEFGVRSSEFGGAILGVHIESEKRYKQIAKSTVAKLNLKVV